MPSSFRHLVSASGSAQRHITTRAVKAKTPAVKTKPINSKAKVQPKPKGTASKGQAAAAPKSAQDLHTIAMPRVYTWKTEATTDAEYMRPAKWKNWSRWALDEDLVTTFKSYLRTEAGPPKK